MRIVLTSLFLIYSSICSASIFDEVKKVDNTLKRMEVADRIFQSYFRSHDSIAVLQSLQELDAIAVELHDVLLSSFSLSTKGDYYARIRGFSSVSTNYLFQAIELVRNKNSKLAETISTYKLGRYYYNFQKYPQAFEYLLKANNMAKEMGYSSDLQVGWIAFYLALAYQEIGDLDNAATYYKICLPFKTDNERYKIILSNNNLATIATHNKQFTEAIQYLQVVIDAALKYGDKVWIGLAKGFIGNILCLQKKYSAAKPNLLDALAENIKYKEWEHALTCAINLANIEIDGGNLLQAEKYLSTADTLLQKNNSLLNQKKYYEASISLYQKQGKLTDALAAAKKVQLLSDSLQQQINLQDYKNIELRVETERHLAELNAISLKSKNAAFKRNAIIVVLFLVSTLLFVFYTKQKQKSKADKLLHHQQEALLESEKLRAEEALQNASLLLKSYTESIRQKNELIEQVSSELEKLKNNQSYQESNPDRVAYFENLLQSTILTAEDGDNFRAIFNKVHPGFFYQLKEQYPNLSESDRRLLSPIKLQLSNREMANMQGVSIDAVKKAKQRLRKKMAPSDETFELENIVINI
jgi:hypothetical protein